MPDRLRLGLVFGGRSVEHEVSVVSAQHVMVAADPDVACDGEITGGAGLRPGRVRSLGGRGATEEKHGDEDSPMRRADRHRVPSPPSTLLLH